MLLDRTEKLKRQVSKLEKQIRKTKHLQENLNEIIDVKLFKPINNNKEYIGILTKFDDESIYLKVDNQIIEFERKNISLIKKYYNWDLD